MSEPAVSTRHVFSSTLLEAAKINSAIFAISSDSKGSVTMDDFEKALPAQFVEAGIAEQDAVGIAAGLSKSGKRVFVCGPASFYSARSLEQVKVDVAYAASDVKVIGISGGLSYGALGSTHHSLHDLAVMRTFPGLGVFLPCDNYQTAAVTRYLSANAGPVYMRLGRSPALDVYAAGCGQSFMPGQAVTLREGTDCAIIAAGETVQGALGAALLLEKEGIKARVLDFWSIKPIDREAIVKAARESGMLFTVEEHSVYGGLGSAVAEIVVQECPVPMKIVGVPDEWVPSGSPKELFDYYGFTSAKLAATIKAGLKAKGKR
jgi:transketolase